MIPVKCLSSSDKKQPYEFSGSFLDLKAGGDKGLDVICRRHTLWKTFCLRPLNLISKKSLT